jgi:hypothetical protein
MKLTEPWFEAEFIAHVDAGSGGHVRQGDQLEGAQGVFIYSPCHYGETEGAHGLIVLFANPRGAAVVPASDHYAKPRWTMGGSSLSDLTLTPSINCQVADLPNGECRPGRKCWHGFITNGEIR